MLKKIKSYIYYLVAIVFGKVKFKDKFGVEYYLWINTRLRHSILSECRTDDTGVIYCIQDIASFLNINNKKNICMDVGAFIGVISLHISKVFNDSCCLYSFEANNLNFHRLKINTKNNKNITIIPYAVSDEKGESQLVLTKDPGQHHLVKNNLNKDDIVQKINTITIGNFAKEHNLQFIDFIKIDAEQYDYEVLLGMEYFLKEDRVSFIIFEYDVRCQILLEKYNYKVLFIARNKKYLSKNKMDNTLNAVAVSSVIDIDNVFRYYG